MDKLYVAYIVTLIGGHFLISSCDFKPTHQRVCKVLPVKKINKCYRHQQYSSVWCNVEMGNGKPADLSAPVELEEERRVCKEVKIELY